MEKMRTKRKGTPTSAVMTPIGLVMSYAAFIAKDNHGRWRHAFSLFGAGVIVVAGLTWLGMSALGNAIGSDGHSHDHGSTETPAESNVPPADQEQPAEAPAEPADDGHSSHSH